ncbi:MAG: Flp pilus assembly complex ATPase component TadA [Lachnospiraceae bacterium]|nr:Flp pilus assembly complex ATPase component TadA [Lachnospiraceae bacterium]
MRKRAEPEKEKRLQEMVQEYLEKLIFSTEKLPGISKEEQQKQALQRSRLRKAIRECALGSSGDRIFVKEYIKEILVEKLRVREEQLETVISFEHPSSLSMQDKFEILQVQLFREYQADWFRHLYHQSRQIVRTAKETKEQVFTEQQLEAIYQQQPELDFLGKLECVTQRLYQELYGYSVCDRLISEDTAVEGISGGCGGKKQRGNAAADKAVYGYDTVYVMLEGKKIRLAFLSFGSERTLAVTVRRVSRNHSKAQLSRRHSYLVTNLKSNSRVVAFRPPVSDGWGFYVRKFQTVSPRRMEELITDAGAEAAISLLRLLVQGEMNVMITGEQASGKTTLLKSLVGFIPEKYSIRVAETVFESRLSELYPERNIHSMQEYGATSLGDVITFFKKTDTDVTICGEINDFDTAGAMVQVAQSGGRFTISTSHHGTTDKLLHYMRNALLTCGGFRDEGIALEQAMEAVQFDVHLEADRCGHRYLARITEIIPEQGGGYALQDILQYRNGKYLLCKKIWEEHAERIRRNVPEWKAEAAAALLKGEQ